MLVAVDFDGTLAPIVARPEEAALTPGSRRALERLAARPDTDLAVISGRALEDVRARVALEGVFYGGNYGMELEGPGVEHVYEPAAAIRPRLTALAVALRERLAGIDGAIVEDKGLTLSVHYRLVAGRDGEARVRERVDSLCVGAAGIRLSSGKKVVEIRPDVAWDKGRAVRFLLRALQIAEGSLVPIVFIGDDESDEEAFRALAGVGDGVLVAESPAERSAAVAWLRGPDEVASLLLDLAEAG